MRWFISCSLATKTFVCEQCGKDFREEWSLKNHLQVHSDVRDHQCDVCSKGYVTHISNFPSQTFYGKTAHFRFKSKYTLDAHMVIHRDERRFKCHLCEKSYNRKKSLAIHLEIHVREVKKVPCDLCNETFLMKSAMIEHRSSHTGDRIYR